MNAGSVERSRGSVHCDVDMMKPARPTKRQHGTPRHTTGDLLGILRSANSISDAFGNASFKLSNSHSSSCATVIADGCRASASLTLRYTRMKPSALGLMMDGWDTKRGAYLLSLSVPLPASSASSSSSPHPSTALQPPHPSPRL